MRPAVTNSANYICTPTESLQQWVLKPEDLSSNLANNLMTLQNYLILQQKLWNDTGSRALAMSLFWRGRALFSFSKHLPRGPPAFLALLSLFHKLSCFCQGTAVIISQGSILIHFFFSLCTCSLIISCIHVFQLFSTHISPEL